MNRNRALADAALAEDSARALIADGWFQVSRKYRTVARLPEGKTGKEALLESSRRSVPDAPRWVACLSERDAADYWGRVHARAASLWLELDVATFAAFRRLGGGCR